MPEKDHLESAKVSVAIVGELVKAAGNDPTVKEAASNLGQAALTVSRTINNALLPLAAVNFAFDKARTYFEGKFQSDLAEKAANIPPESVQEPKASIAGPALQGLAFAHEESSLKDMFLSLLATAMDSRRSDSAHPAFVEIIKQLDATEAPLLVEILKKKSYVPIAKIKLEVPDGSGELDLFRHLVNMRDEGSGSPVVTPKFPAMLDNWQRLGLIEVHYDAWMTQENSYDWVEQRPEFIRFRESHTEEQGKVSFDKGYMRLTNLGALFASAVQSESL